MQYSSVETPFLSSSSSSHRHQQHLQQRQRQQRSNSSSSKFDPKSPPALMRRLSWRCVAIFFVVLALALSAALAYVTGERKKRDLRDNKNNDQTVQRPVHSV